MIPNPTVSCLYEIEEYTRNERVAVGANGNILRWAPSGGPEQKWLIIPISDRKCRIMTASNGEYMSVGNDGNILRWGLSGYEQEFDFVNPNPDDSWNIKESTRGEHVAVGWNGNILRWSATGDRTQRFRLLPSDPPPPPPLQAGTHLPGMIEDVPRVKGFNNPIPPLRSARFLIGEVSIPSSLVSDDRFGDLLTQNRDNPYYILRREQFWDRSEPRGYYLDHDGTPTTLDIAVKTGLSEKQAHSVERLLSVQINVGGTIGFKAPIKGVEISGTASISRQITESLKLTETHETTTTYERTERIAVALPAYRMIWVSWALVDSYELRRASDGSVVDQWDIVAPDTRVVDRFPEAA
jgi:hypothetical protein